MNSQFFFDDDERIGRCLALCGEWSPRLAPIIEQEGVRSLRLSLSNGWKGDHVGFLTEVPSVVTGFEVFSGKVSDLSPLMEREGVEHLAFQVALKRPLDLGAWSGLRTLKFSFSAKTKNLQKCSRLEHLNVMAFPGENLEWLASMNVLRRLQVTSRTLRCLVGLSNLKNLRMVDFAECPNLKDLHGIETLASLEEIEIANCKAIGSLPCLSSLGRLRSLIIDDCGTLDSLHFLNGNDALERVLVIGDTRVADGDLSPLTLLPNLRDVRIAEGDYNLSSSEVLELTQGRWGTTDKRALRGGSGHV